MKITMIAAALGLMSTSAFAADLPIDVAPTPSGVEIPIYEGPHPIPVYGQYFYGGYDGGYSPYYRPYPYYYRPRPFIRFGPFGFGFGHHRHWRGGHGHRW